MISVGKEKFNYIKPHENLNVFHSNFGEFIQSKFSKALDMLEKSIP
jgi:hypothetical protein